MIKQNGRSTSNFIRTIRLHKAKELLENTQMNVSEISFEMGMSDRSCFSRKFKEEFDLSPSELMAKRVCTVAGIGGLKN